MTTTWKQSSSQYRTRRRGKRLGGVILLFFALLLFGLMAMTGFGALPKNGANISALRERHISDYESYDALLSGTRIALTGTLADNPTVEDDVVAIRRDMLIGTGRKNDRFKWSVSEAYLPNLNIAIEGGVVQTSHLQYVSLEGENIEFLETFVSGGYDYRGAKIGKGSTRTFTLRNGDSVTLIGVIQPDYTIGLEMLYGATTPTELESKLSKERLGYSLAFFGMMIGGLVLIPLGISRIKEGHYW